MQRWLIQGFFFQGRSELAAAYLTGDGPVAVMRTEMMAHLFAGIIYSNPDGVLIGDMQDVYGVAQLSDIELSLNRLAFVKAYVNHRDPIRYAFNRQEVVWTGEWSGPSVGRGSATCLLHDAPERLFTKPL